MDEQGENLVAEDAVAAAVAALPDDAKPPVRGRPGRPKGAKNKNGYKMTGKPRGHNPRKPRVNPRPDTIEQNRKTGPTLTRKNAVSQKQAIMAFRAKDGDQYSWYPQVDEPAKGYIYFKAFLDLGPGRTRQAVAEIAELNHHTISKWAQDWNWDQRAQAYDAHLLAVEFTRRDAEVAKKAAVWESRRDSIREWGFENAQAMIAKAKEMLEWPLEEVTEHSEEEVDLEGKTVVVHHYVTRMPVKWTQRDVAAFVKIAEQLFRLSAQMPTSNQNITVEEKRTNTTVKLVVKMVEKGFSLEEVRGKLVDMGVKAEDIDGAIESMRQNQEPKQIAGERLS